MSRLHDAPPELLELLFAVCDDAATGEQMAELDRHLLDRPDELQLFYDLLQLEADLQLREQADRATQLGLARIVDRAVPTESAPRAWLRRLKEATSHPTALSLLVAGLFVSAVLLSLALWTLPQWRGQPTAPQTARSQIVAAVMLARDAQWAPASLVQGRPPVDLFIGETVELLQGTVAIRFDSGAVALLEGPATFTPQRRNRLLLREGKLAARVPERAIGFLVSTPTVDVLDLGTEFSVQADKTGTAVQVLSGRVEVHRIERGGRAIARVLTAGQAALFGDSPSQGFYVQEKEMNRAIFLGMMALLGGVGPGAVDAATLRVDIGAVDQVKHEDYLAFSRANTTGLLSQTENYATAFGNVEVRLSARDSTGGPESELGFRNRSQIAADNPAFDLNDLLRDLVKSNGNDNAPDKSLLLTLSGLAPGVYEITTYHHEGSGDPGGIDILLTDALGADQLLFEDFQQSGGANPASVAAATFQFTADGNPVVIELREAFAGFRGGTPFSEAVLNGFALTQLQAVPEPATYGMSLISGGLGIIVLLRRRRRLASSALRHEAA